jgi:hypothetical protein
MFGQSFGDGAADPSRGARDDRKPPGQVEQTGQDILPKGQRVSTIALFAAATPEAIGQEFTAFFLGYRGDCHTSAESCNFRHAVSS